MSGTGFVTIIGVFGLLTIELADVVRLIIGAVPLTCNTIVVRVACRRARRAFTQTPTADLKDYP
jgi:hypothetical protein